MMRDPQADIHEEIAEMFSLLAGRERLADALEVYRAQEGERYRERMEALRDRELIAQRVEHGYRKYTTFRCRCDVCRSANAAHQRAYATQRRARDPEFKAKRARYEAGRRARAARRDRVELAEAG